MQQKQTLKQVLILLSVLDEAHYVISEELESPDFDDHDEFSDPVWNIIVEKMAPYFEGVTQEELEEYVAIREHPTVKKVEESVIEAMVSDDFIIACETISTVLEQRKNLGPMN